MRQVADPWGWSLKNCLEAAAWRRQRRQPSAPANRRIAAPFFTLFTCSPRDLLSKFTHHWPPEPLAWFKSDDNAQNWVLATPESMATLLPFGTSQWESQKNRFAFICFGKFQFLPPCVWDLPFMSCRLWCLFSWHTNNRFFVSRGLNAADMIRNAEFWHDIFFQLHPGSLFRCFNNWYLNFFAYVVPTQLTRCITGSCVTWSPCSDPAVHVMNAGPPCTRSENTKERSQTFLPVKRCLYAWHRIINY